MIPHGNKVNGLSEPWGEVPPTVIFFIHDSGNTVRVFVYVGGDFSGQRSRFGVTISRMVYSGIKVSVLMYVGENSGQRSSFE